MIVVTALTGQTFAGYEILTQIGEGGMGVVYKARQRSPDRMVAIKIMAPQLSGDETFLNRFIREASVAAGLRHPNMVLVHGAGEHEGVYHIVMEFVDGESVLERIHRRGRLDACEALAITVYVAQALQYAWTKAKLIHRDVKPANILLSSTGEVKLGDLGLAKSMGQSTAGTMVGMVLGSPHYMSPEQARALREIDFRADIYSLGCTLYHMVMGRRPYEGCDTPEVLLQQISGPLPALSELWPQCPLSLSRLLNRMLAKQPELRPQSYDDLLKDLRQVHGELKAAAAQLEARSTMVVPASKRPKASALPVKISEAKPAPAAGKRSSPVIACALIGGLALLAGLLWWTLWKPGADGSAGRRQNVPHHADPAWTNAIGLLPLVDPQRDAVRGVWRLQEGALISDSEVVATMEIPYEPGSEYDFRIDFTCPDVPGHLCQVLSKSGHAFSWVMDSKSNGLTGFEGVAAQGFSNNPSPAVQGTDFLQTNQTHVCVVAVRNDRLRAYLNDQLMAEWKTDYSDGGLPSHWKLRADGVLGLGSDGSSVIFRKVMVREVTGKGKFVRVRPE